MTLECHLVVKGEILSSLKKATIVMLEACGFCFVWNRWREREKKEGRRDYDEMDTDTYGDGDIHGMRRDTHSSALVHTLPIE